MDAGGGFRMVTELLKDYCLILASHSPRRKELLSGLDLPYEVRTIPDIDESYPESLTKDEIPVYIARKKAAAYRPLLLSNEILITADTIVWLDGKVYGKPADETDAIHMLRSLSGHTHEVLTGVCISDTKKEKSFCSISKVKFAELEADEITYYVQKYKPYDKAGSYGVQEWIGYIGVESLEGSFYNVMGLPVRMLYRELKRWKS
ncbi:MAG: Maf-like protein [Dysgonamonadaceae bacterium]|jgi:septum formation protein|nr:Maf-like protein [Dysgonamonadaceae bacterium]